MKVKKSVLKGMAIQLEAFSQFLSESPDVVKAIQDESVEDDQEFDLTDEQAKAIGLSDGQQGEMDDYLNEKFKK